MKYFNITSRIFAMMTHSDARITPYLQKIIHALHALGFHVQGVIGQGVYGFVLSATNTRTRREEAIKIMPPHKHSGIMPVNALREVSALTNTAHHNVTASKGVYVFTDGTAALRMSLYTCTLRTLLTKHRRYFLPLDVVQYIFSEVVKGVAAMASDFGLVHRDLKPENILIRWEGKQIAVADWGMSRSGVGIILPIDTVFTREVISRFYAPPETLTGTGAYTSTIDVWSLGVMLAEMISGKMIFPTIETASRRGFVSQSVFEILGTPIDPQDIFFFKQVCDIDVHALGEARPSILTSQLQRRIPETTMALLQSMLKYTNRPTIQEIAASEYVVRAKFPVAGIPFSSCATTPRVDAQDTSAAGADGSHVAVVVSFPCYSTLGTLRVRNKTQYDGIHGWEIGLFTPLALYRAWGSLQTLGTIRQRAHIWLSAMCISHELRTSGSTAGRSNRASELLAATVSLAAASVMLTQRRFELAVVKCIDPSVSARSLHVAECYVFAQCHGYLPASPTWVDELTTHASIQIACESVCHGRDAQEIHLSEFIAACHSTKAPDETCAIAEDDDIASSTALQTLVALRKRFP